MDSQGNIARKYAVVEKLFGYLGGLCIFFSMCYVAIDVFARAVFKTSIGGGTDQLISMITVFVGYLPLAYTMSQGAHVTMTAITDRLTGRMKIISQIWTYLFCALFFVFMTYATFTSGFLRAYSTKEAVEASFSFKLYLWYGKICQPVGCAAIAVTSLLQLVQSIINLIHYRPADDPNVTNDEGGGTENE